MRDPIFQIGVYVILALTWRTVAPGRRSNTLLAAVVLASLAATYHFSGTQLDFVLARGTDLMRGWAGAEPSWPPKLHQGYPDLELLD